MVCNYEFLLKFRFRSVVEMSRSLLNDADLVSDGFMLDVSVEENEEGDRLYSELNTGLWWEHALSDVPEGATLLPLIFYTDKTWLSLKGKHTVQPIAMTLGNFPIRVQNKHEAKRTICYIPELTAPESSRKREAYKRFSRRLYHLTWEAVLRSVRSAQEEGGFKQMFGGVEKVFFPVVAAVVNDNPEGQKAAGIMNSPKGAEPCRVCRCSGADFANPTEGLKAEIRCTVETEQFLKRTERSCNVGSKEWKDALRSRSCKCFPLIISYFHKAVHL